MQTGRKLTRKINSAFLALLALAACDSGGSSVTNPPGGDPPAPAQIIVQLSGVPAAPGQADALRISGFGARIRGPGSLDTVVLTSVTLPSVAAGRYTITARSAEFDSIRFSVNPDSLQFDLAESAVRVVSLAWTPATGGIDLRVVGGPPDTTRLSALLTHPGGRVDSLVLPARLSLLVPGTYIVTPLARSVGGVMYSPLRGADTVVVSAGPTGTATVLAFGAQYATLKLAIDNVPPADRLGFVSLISEDGGVRRVSAASDTIVYSGLLAGRYIVQADSFFTASARYVPERGADTLAIEAGTENTRTIEYRKSTAALTLLIEGVPGGAQGSVTVSGPGGFLRTLNDDTVLSDLVPGTYTITAASIAANAHTYAPALPVQVAILELDQPQSRVVRYALATGALAIAVSGLPEGVPANITVTSGAIPPAQGFPWAVTGSATRTNIAPGSYTVNATTVMIGAVRYVPTPAQQSLSIVPSLIAVPAVVTYVETVGETLDFSIDGAYITQAAQTRAGTVPIVASRSALMRIFVRANEGNNELLTARVRLFQGAAEYRTILVPSPVPSVPLESNEGVLEQSWNVLLDAGDVREGMRFIVDFGDAPGVSDANPANNRWPAAGSHPVDVRVVPPAFVTFVPIHHPLDGLTGNVTPANAASLFRMTSEMFPLERTTVSVRAPFTTSAPPLLHDDSNSGWITVLNEMSALRLAEGANADHYAAIVGTTYSTGIAGLAGVGTRHLVSWDKFNTAARVFAHELGHNFGRYHSPGCGAAFIDPGYPHGGGSIGVWGWTGSSLMSPTTTNDIMGYCSVQWISDYTWTGVMEYRSINGFETFTRGGAASVASDSVLLLWGILGADHAKLEPAFRLLAKPSLPAVGGGRYTLEILDSRERVLHTVRFDGDAIDHRDELRTFAFTVPVRSWTSAATTIRIREGSRVLAERHSSSSLNVPDAVTRVRADDGHSLVSSPMPSITRRGAGNMQLKWNTAAWPTVMVRDASTGHVLMFARADTDTTPDSQTNARKNSLPSAQTSAQTSTRGVDARIGGASTLELVFSDGVRSVTQRVVVR